MDQARIALLPDRGVVAVKGPDARKLLQGIVTNDLDVLDEPRGDGLLPAAHAGLLSPQGKILFDFFVVASGEHELLLDVARDKAAELAKRITMYRLRAQVEIAEVSGTHVVQALWGPAAHPAGSLAFADPRHPSLGVRLISLSERVSEDAKSTNGRVATEDDYHTHRISLGVPEGGKDWAFGDTFPHEALFDHLNGVSFKKGCYVGQEVVSRMQHRGTARKRVVPVVATEPLPASGTEIRAGGQLIGTLGSTAGKRGLALLRLDRASEEQAKGADLMAGSVTVQIELPAWLKISQPVAQP